jgi:hypothetical protein
VFSPFWNNWGGIGGWGGCSLSSCGWGRGLC